MLSLEKILEKISELTLQIQQCQDLTHMAQGSIDDARLLLQTDRVLIYRFLPGEDAVVAFESVGAEWTPLIGQLIYDPCFQASWVERYKQGETTAISDVHNTTVDPCYVTLLERLQVQANLVVPILSQNTLWGLLIAHHCHQPRQWQPLEVQYLQQIALHLGVAVQYANLQQSYQQVLAEREQHAIGRELTECGQPDRSPDHPPSEAVLQEREYYYAQILNSVQDMIFCKAPGSIITYANQAACTYYGMTLEQLRGITDVPFNQLDFTQQYLQDDLHVFATGEVVDRPEEPNQRYDGEVRYFHTVKSPIFDAAGNIRQIVGVSRDVTERKQAERLLRRYERIFSATLDCVSLIDRNYIYQVVNQTYLKWRQKSPDAIVGHSVSQVLGQEFFSTVAKPYLDRCLAGEAQQILETWQDYQDGQRRYVRATYVPYLELDGTISGVVVNVHDLTGLKQAEEALRESETRFRLMSNSAPVMIWTSGLDAGCDFFNDGWLNFTGRTLAQELGNGWIEGIHPDDLQQCLETYHTAFRGQLPFEMEYRLRRADGEYRWILDRGTPRFNPNGTFAGFIGSCLDISDHKQLERSLWLTDFSLEYLAVSAIWFDRHAKIRRVNATTCAVLGYLREELQTLSLEQIDPSFSPTKWNQFWQMLEQQKNLTFVSEHQTKAGEIIPVEVTVRYMEFAGEAYSFAIAKDIRERRQRENKLRLQSTALEACADIIMITDNRGIIEWVNPAFTRITGYLPEEAIGKNPSELVKSGQHDASFYHSLWKTILAGKTWRGELINRRKDGSCYTESATITPVPDQQGEIRHFVAIKQDISDRKRAELAIQQQTKRERMIQAMTSRIRHSLDLAQILHTTVTEVQHFLTTDRVLIYRFSPDWSGIVVAESVAKGWRSILGMQITDRYFVETQGQTYLQGHIAAIDDIYTANLDPCHVEMMEQIQVRAKLIVPILQNNCLWGLLVAHHCQNARHWEPFEIALQQQLAAQIAIAIQQSELYQQVQTLNTELELQVQERTAQLQQALAFEVFLKHITDQVRDSLDENQVLKKVVQELGIALNVDCCDTAIYNLDRTATIVKYEYNQDGCIAQNSAYQIANSSDPHLYVQLFQGQYCHFCLVEQNVVRPDQPQKTILACPIMDDQGILGDMWLFRPAQTVFNELEVRLVQQVTNQCAIALRQSRLYQAAQVQVQELERLNQLKDDFLSTVSHELRTPMSNIKIATQMLEVSLNHLGILTNGSNPVSRYFKVLQEEGQREISLINDLLDLTRLDAGTEPLNLSEVDLPVYLPHLAESWIARMTEQQQQFVLQVPAHLPPLTTDLPYLERILTELLNNACKYTPARETITLSVQPTPVALEIRVCNSGVEIPSIECDRIFDKFYRIPNNDPWKHGGTGLGLALVKKLVETLGGAIVVESAENQTCFIVKLPNDHSDPQLL